MTSLCSRRCLVLKHLRGDVRQDDAGITPRAMITTPAQKCHLQNTKSCRALEDLIARRGTRAHAK